ncbi:oligosaccharide flippase family protein [bacterium]|nr:oligosaccharide flippase family protein [bacterium]
MFCTIAFTFALARLLCPSDFGAVATLLFFFDFFNWATEWGWEQGLMANREAPLSRAASTHLWIRIVTGFLPLLVIGLFFPLVVKMIPPHRMTLLSILCLAYFFEKMSLTYRTVLERTYKLKHLAAFEFSANVFSYTCAFIAAIFGLGAMSLVIQRLVEKMTMFFGYLWSSPWKFGIEWDLKIAKASFKTFGIASWSGGILALVAYTSMIPLISSLVGTHQAGLYSRAFSMGTFPIMLTAIFQRLTLPIYAHNQFKPDPIRRVFIKAQSYKFILLVIPQAMLAITSYWWIPIFLGPQWIEVIPVYQALAVYGIVRAFYDDVVPVLTYGFKRPWEIAKNHVVQAVIIVTLGPIAVISMKALGGAIVMSFSMVVVTLIFWRKVFDTIQCRRKDFILQFAIVFLRARRFVRGHKVW